MVGSLKRHSLCARRQAAGDLATAARTRRRRRLRFHPGFAGEALLRPAIRRGRVGFAMGTCGDDPGTSEGWRVYTALQASLMGCNTIARGTTENLFVAVHRRRFVHRCNLVGVRLLPPRKFPARNRYRRGRAGGTGSRERRAPSRESSAARRNNSCSRLREAPAEFLSELSETITLGAGQKDIQTYLRSGGADVD